MLAANGGETRLELGERRSVGATELSRVVRLDWRSDTAFFGALQLQRLVSEIGASVAWPIPSPNPRPKAHQRRRLQQWRLHLRQRRCRGARWRRKAKLTPVGEAMPGERKALPAKAATVAAGERVAAAGWLDWKGVGALEWRRMRQRSRRRTDREPSAVRWWQRGWGGAKRLVVHDWCGGGGSDESGRSRDGGRGWVVVHEREEVPTGCRLVRVYGGGRSMLRIEGGTSVVGSSCGSGLPASWALMRCIGDGELVFGEGAGLGDVGEVPDVSEHGLGEFALHEEGHDGGAIEATFLGDVEAVEKLIESDLFFGSHVPGAAAAGAAAVAVGAAQEGILSAGDWKAEEAWKLEPVI